MYQSDLEFAEPLEAYCPGGYHPVHLEDEFKHGQYKILHKLGIGGFSNVWLAHDNQYIYIGECVRDLVDRIDNS